MILNAPDDSRLLQEENDVDDTNAIEGDASDSDNSLPSDDEMLNELIKPSDATNVVSIASTSDNTILSTEYGEDILSTEYGEESPPP